MDPRKYQSVSFGGGEPLDEVTKLEDIEGMANGKSHGLQLYKQSAACWGGAFLRHSGMAARAQNLHAPEPFEQKISKTP